MSKGVFTPHDRCMDTLEGSGILFATLLVISFLSPQDDRIWWLVLGGALGVAFVGLVGYLADVARERDKEE